ncbi:MAG: 50S ribosomal protein L13 [Candidatus Lambdaproteobacteria bacterium RIFOXYD1_FULL_56_27]|uniref:Large ribosomal subunit protein uL13 n=1 Tax=Candidatus Lambdaproteobacteria bacterium RIFOXYD2_FULL_56_26 TaxID=1817773 RepID=A0A1F6H2J9_9PROT|nr:MAG: 50S ribosomal protein L13 [Candidatus Lambdaproteobacteria bacterium RIFOXYC1_FULL_56_13]OGH04599.1 MAG: 50S ribosomal protein L13 [Candidatus Lambdaproteobacteria bacterium RIFOXYD2_FULL_56_26]OGH09063.1 MAG: 50S ribosomal protein L13 [Candidatus Lambdaproteobacteria bacterium RIFOXYD1_FULL_56_27]
MKTTPFVSNEEYQQGERQKEWYLLDAEGKTLGRIATQIAMILQGKHKPTYTPHVDTGDYVVVVNASKVKVTGAKAKDKNYYYHTGFPGGLKQANFEALMAKKPGAAIEHAVKGMLPKNQLNRNGIDKLKVYAGAEHPHQAQSLTTLDF